MNTQFTMNSGSVTTNLAKLQELGAMTVTVHTDKTEGRSNNDMTHPMSFTLPAGTTFAIPGVHSRSSLKKLLGNAAMVRGVKHL